jgi:protease-4
MADDTPSPRASADLSPETRRFLDEVAKLIAPVNNQQRRRHRFSVIRWAIGLTLVAGVLASNMLAPKIQQYVTFNNDYVVSVPIKGPIMDEGSASPSTVIPLLEKAFKDDSAKGILLSINSPGGAPVAADAIRDRIVSLRKAHPEKRVIAVGQDFMTSGAYLIALGAESIYASEPTSVGSIGVIVRSFGFQDLLAKYGVERRVLAAGENKAGLDQFLPLAEDDREEFTQQLEDIHQWFIDRVQDARGEKLVESDDLFSGKQWLGEKALQLGLIDGIGTLTGVSELLFGTTNVRKYQVRQSLREMLNPLASAVGGSIVMADQILPTGTFYAGPLLMPK